MSKFNFPHKNDNKSNKGVKNQIFFYGVVTSIDDDFDACRIKVRIKGVDDHINSVDLPFAFPLMPKFFGVKPKIGETVLVFTPENDNPFTDRFYLGPLVSQPQFLDFSDMTTARSGLDTGYTDLRPGPNKIPEVKGVYPMGTDTVIQGRDNTDIVFGKGEILIRTGKFDASRKVNGVPTFNFKNQGYIQIKSNYKVGDGNKRISLMNIVADKINLLTHENGSPVFALNDQTKQISDEEIIKILSTAHPAVFGDTLLEYISLMRSVILNHVHSYPGNKAQNLQGESDIQKLLDFDVRSILSKNIKLN